ncbi:MAG: 1-acyl-sn-glycerol-3-phosphate acyltransferase, partial [Anaerolineales bacterium]|nr:1-acyl-sn-glycerol-3-phosphate acyltransferase [Anaerolineales bacterium]
MRNLPLDRDTNQEYLRRLQEALLEEIYKLFGAPQEALGGKALRALFQKPVTRLAELTAQFEILVRESGLPEASRWMWHHFVDNVHVLREADTPTEGPLLVVSNHPGMVDGFIVAGTLPRRDLKLVVSNLPFFTNLQALRDHVIYTTKETHERLTVVRQSIRHLRAGGALLIFPGGNIEPDPAVLPGMRQAIDRWSSSIEIMIRSVPNTQVVVSIVSGVVEQSSLRHPLVYIKKNLQDRQKVAEAIQAIRQLVRSK